jgi:energy-converting hydrogenase Eha subunit G
MLKEALQLTIQEISLQTLMLSKTFPVQHVAGLSWCSWILGMLWFWAVSTELHSVFKAISGYFLELGLQMDLPVGFANGDKITLIFVPAPRGFH